MGSHGVAVGDYYCALFRGDKTVARLYDIIVD